jgi:hypothetical protein
VGTYTTDPDADGEETGLAVQANITENTGEVLTGTASGQVWVWQAERPGPFSMRFRIEADPAVSDETERACIFE